MYCCPKVKLKKYFNCDLFLWVSLWGLKISTLGHCTRDLFPAINASAEI